MRPCSLSLASPLPLLYRKMKPPMKQKTRVLLLAGQGWELQNPDPSKGVWRLVSNEPDRKPIAVPDLLAMELCYRGYFESLGRVPGYPERFRVTRKTKDLIAKLSASPTLLKRD